MNDQRSYAGTISAIIGLIALLAKLFAWHWVQVLASDVPSTTAILGYVIPGAAIVIGAITHPAHLVRDPIVTGLQKVRAWFAPPVIPPAK